MQYEVEDILFLHWERRVSEYVAQGTEHIIACLTAADELGLRYNAAHDTVHREKTRTTHAEAVSESYRLRSRTVDGAGTSHDVPTEEVSDRAVRPSRPGGIGSHQFGTPFGAGANPTETVPSSELRRTTSMPDGLPLLARVATQTAHSPTNTMSVHAPASPLLVGMADMQIGGNNTANGQRFTMPVGGNNGPKMQISLPARFDPVKSKWFTWSRQTKRVFTMMSLVETLNESNRPSVTAQTQQIAIAILHEIMPQVDSDMFVDRAIEFADDIWTFLERKYKSRDEFRKHELHRNFSTMSQQTDETVAAWITRLSSVKSELVAMGGEVPTLTHKLALLDRTLPCVTPGLNNSHQEGFFADLRQNMATMSITQIEDRLLSRADCYKEQQAVQSAGVSQTMQFKRGGRGGRMGRGRSSAPGRGYGGRGAGAMTDRQFTKWCTVCGAKGHIGPECPARYTPEGKELVQLQRRLRKEHDTGEHAAAVNINHA